MCWCTHDHASTRRLGLPVLRLSRDRGMSVDSPTLQEAEEYRRGRVCLPSNGDSRLPFGTQSVTISF